MDQLPGQDGSRPRRSWSLATIARIGALPALIGVLVGTGALARLIPQDPYVRAAEEAGAAMLDLPGFEDRFGALEDDEAFRVGAELGVAAIPRLPNAELGEWLTITRQLLSALDVEACATMIRGSGDADEALAAFKTLDVETYRRYLDIVQVGIHLVLTDATAPPPPSQQEIDDALALLARATGADRMQEIGMAMASPGSASDSEVCSAARDLYAAVGELDDRSWSILIRMLTGPVLSA